MEILGIEKVSFVDYEGLLCATIFTGGCNFLCPFCHNSALVKRRVDRIPENQVLSYLRERKGLLDAVTISGGEPTIQKDLSNFILKVKEMGYKVKLDTNGTFPQVVEDLLDKGLLDYVAMDIKNNFDDYAKVTGVCNVNTANIKRTLSILRKYKLPYELRTTLVKEFHNKNNIIKMAEDLKGENCLYLQKFVDSGECIEGGLNSINKQEAIEYQNILSKTIKNVILRGY